MAELNEVSDEEIATEWKRRQGALANHEKRTNATSTGGGDTQQAQRDIINQKPKQSYEELKAEWNRRRGILQHDAIFITGMAKEDVEEYQKLRNEWYSRQGKRTPEAIRKKWDQRLATDKQKYSR